MTLGSTKHKPVSRNKYSEAIRKNGPQNKSNETKTFIQDLQTKKTKQERKEVKERKPVTSS